MRLWIEDPTLVACEVLIVASFIWIYSDACYNGLSGFLAYLRSLCLRASRLITPHDGSRRRRLHRTTTSYHEYPVVSLRRIPDGALVGEHSPPYKIPTSTGDEVLVRDPNQWLEDDKSLRTVTWIEAQRDFTSNYLSKLLRKETLTEFRDKIRESSRFQEIASVFQCGTNFFYFSRQRFTENIGDIDRQFVMYVTDDLSLEGSVLLDPENHRFSQANDCNSLGPSPPYIRGTWVSNEGIWVAYGYSTSNQDPWMTLRLRNVGLRIDPSDDIDVIQGVCHMATTSVEWLDRAGGFFYSCYSTPPGENGVLPAESKHRVCFHRLGTHQREDILIYEEGLEFKTLGGDCDPDASANNDSPDNSAESNIPISQDESVGRKNGSENHHKRKKDKKHEEDEDEKEIENEEEEEEYEEEEGSDADSGLGSDTWTENRQDDGVGLDGDSAQIGYTDWPGRKETFRLRVSADGRYLFIEIYLDGMDATKGVDNVFPDSTRSTHANKLYYYELSAFRGQTLSSMGQCVKLIDSFDSRWQYIVNIEEELWLRTNYLAPNFRIMRISLPDLDIFESVSKRYLAGVLRSIWMYALEWIPESSDGALLEKADIAAHTVLVLKYLRDSSYFVLLYDLTQTLEEASRRHIAELPNARHCHIDGPWCSFQSLNIFYHCSGFAEPGCIFRAMIIRNLFTGSIELQFEPTFTSNVPGLRMSSFETRQDFCETRVHRPILAASTASTVRNLPSANTTFLRSAGNNHDDGPQPYRQPLPNLPMHIFASADTSDKRPCVIFVYGGFGVSVTPAFSLPLILFVKHFDAMVCVVNVRGGGEICSSWHTEARGEGKQKSVDDIITAAEYLIDSGYTTKERLGIMGGTCAGVLIGSCITQRPDLFSAAVVEDGLFDLMRHHILTPGRGGPTFPMKFDDGNASPAASIEPDKFTRSMDDNPLAMHLQPLWSLEFGSAEVDSPGERLTRLLRFSPLHNVRAPAHNIEKKNRRKAQAATAAAAAGTSATIPTQPLTVTKPTFPAVLLVVGEPEDVPVPRAHSFKFIAELQRVCGGSKNHPLLIHIASSSSTSILEFEGGPSSSTSERDKRTNLVVLMLTFLAKFIGASYDDCSENVESDDDGNDDYSGDETDSLAELAELQNQSFDELDGEHSGEEDDNEDEEEDKDDDEKTEK